VDEIDQDEAEALGGCLNEIFRDHFETRIFPANIDDEMY
jgi:hypothetical protein